MAITFSDRRIGEGIFVWKAAGATQSDGAFDIDIAALVPEVHRMNVQVQVVVTGTPTTGSLAIGVRSFGASGFATMSETINMVSGPFLYVLRDVVVDRLRFTPTSFNGTSYDVIVTVF